MPPEYTQELDEVFTSVLESMAFMFADFTPKEEMPESAATPLEVIINFKGDNQGTMTLIAPEDMCIELVENILGMDPDILNEAERFDALGELVNVTCGQMLTAVLGDEPVYDLTPPVVTRVGQDQWARMLQYEHSAGFMVDEHPVLLKFSMAA